MKYENHFTPLITLYCILFSTISQPSPPLTLNHQATPFLQTLKLKNKLKKSSETLNKKGKILPIIQENNNSQNHTPSIKILEQKKILTRKQIKKHQKKIKQNYQARIYFYRKYKNYIPNHSPSQNHSHHHNSVKKAYIKNFEHKANILVKCLPCLNKSLHKFMPELKPYYITPSTSLTLLWKIWKQNPIIEIHPFKKQHNNPTAQYKYQHLTWNQREFYILYATTPQPPKTTTTLWFINIKSPKEIYSEPISIRGYLQKDIDTYLPTPMRVTFAHTPLPTLPSSH